MPFLRGREYGTPFLYVIRSEELTHPMLFPQKFLGVGCRMRGARRICFATASAADSKVLTFHEANDRIF